MSRRSMYLIGCSGFVFVGACNSLATSSVSGTPVGIVLMNARSKGAGFTTSPTINFYNATSITFSSASAASDSCAQGPYSPIGSSGNTATVIGAGAFVVASVSGHTDSLIKATTSDGTYQSLHTSGIPFNPGDSITFTIPGDAAGFPQTSVTAKTAEAFTLNPIVVPPIGQPMTVTWSTGNDANGAMLVSLYYNDGTAPNGLNAQIFCDFHDDGSGTVQAVNIARWAASNQREVLVQRLRTVLFQLPTTTAAYVNVLSTFDLPIPVSP